MDTTPPASNFLSNSLSRLARALGAIVHRRRPPLTIAILSFDRPAYLAEVLASLAPQLHPGDYVLLFQDGATNPHSGRAAASAEKIAACLAAFHAAFPPGASPCRSDVFASGDNLGIAGNYRRAEQFVFERSGCREALFLEDDLVLGPGYLQVISDLLALARRDPRIGYVSAYGNMWASLAAQKGRGGQLDRMHENWGAALTRRSWQAQQPLRDQYWELVRDRDYVERDSAAIRRLYEGHGVNCPITSQDASRWVACSLAGMVRLTTASCHARYIGVEGVHGTREFYEEYRFAAAQVCDQPVKPDRPTEAQIQLWLALDRASFARGYVHTYQERALQSA